MAAGTLTTAIVPTYNRSALLVETLNSLLAQTLPPGEIIVADDGSTDQTRETVAQFGEKIRYFRGENSGKADKLNKAIALARHPLIWIVDDDDLVLPDALKTLTDLIEADPKIGFSYGRYERFTKDPVTGELNRYDGGYWQDVGSDRFLLATLQDFFVHHPGMLVRKSAFELVGPFSTTLPRSEDYEMLIRLARAFPCSGTQKLVFLQRQHDGDRYGGLQASKRVDIWIAEQKSLFESVRADGGLSDYLPGVHLSDHELSDTQRRQALITRGAVMGRKKLWNLAFADFAAACKVAGLQSKLSTDEKAALRATFFSKFGCSELIDDPTIASQVVALSTFGNTGISIAQTLARSLLWFIKTAMKEGHLSDMRKYTILALRFALARPKRDSRTR